MAYGFVSGSLRKSDRAAHRQREVSLWWTLSRTLFASIILIGADGAGAFGLGSAARWTNLYGAHASVKISRPRARCQLKNSSSKTESRGAGSGHGSVESIGSEDNKWGMDKSLDKNAIRMKIMEKAGKARQGDLDARDEWVIIDEDDSPNTVNEVKEALVSSLSSYLDGDLPKTDSVAGVDSSKRVEELDEDTDSGIATFVEQKLDKGTSDLKALADELKTEQDKSSYADRMTDELAQIFKEEEEKAAKEIEKRSGPVKAKLGRAKLELEEAMSDAEDARQAFEGDLFLQLFSFRSKGPLRQAALVGAITLANQAAYQVILLADDRGGSFTVALVGFIASAALVWFYGYRPFSLK